MNLAHKPRPLSQKHYTLNKEALKVLKAYREYLRRIGAVKKPRCGQGG